MENPKGKESAAPPAAAKRSHDAISGEVEELDFASMSRSERKKIREKKRRSDVNKGFDELMALLLEIDPEVRRDAEERTSKGHCKRTLGAHEDNVLSRVDLIATAIKVLKRIHGENEKHKKVIEDLLTGGSNRVFSGNPSALSDLSGLSAGSSLLDRAVAPRLQHQALGLGAAAVNPAAASLRAQTLLSAPSSLGAPGLGSAGIAELLALRAARERNAVAALNPLAGSDAALLAAQLGNPAALQRSLLQNPARPNPAATEALYSALGQVSHPSVVGSVANLQAGKPKEPEEG